MFSLLASWRIKVERVQSWDWQATATTANVLVALFIAILGITPAAAKNRRWRRKLLWAAFALAAFCVVAQFAASRQGHVSDSELVRYYEDKLENKTKQRAEAAAALKEYFEKRDWNSVTADTDGLDYVLGLFDELGYQEVHGKVSASVIHEHLYEEIVPYYQGSQSYIEKVQKEDGPTSFHYLKPLYESIIKIESKGTGLPPSKLRLSDKDFLEYMQSELETGKKP